MPDVYFIIALVIRKKMKRYMTPVNVPEVTPPPEVMGYADG